jgi:hypothetical protein
LFLISKLFGEWGIIGSGQVKYTNINLVCSFVPESKASLKTNEIISKGNKAKLKRASNKTKLISIRIYLSYSGAWKNKQ